ncbi:MAG: dihydroorotase [Saprospiraceae bacterium]|nr:dihydroorotase [Saprospiraceae bacterium]
MQRILIKGALVINRGKSQYMDVLTENDKIVKIDPQINIQGKYQEINGDGLWLIPGIIDDQVHFREPGFTHKADIASESKAAIAGGVTSFMEMPNTNPATLTQTLLQEKYDVAAKHSYANYSFFMGASNDNYDEVMRTNPTNVCGIKIFMGSSTGNMLVDNHATLNHLFANVPMLIATHCEDESTIRQNLAEYKTKYNDQLTAEMHPLIRSAEGCFRSSSMAIELAKKYNTRLHILHISTADEIGLFKNNIPLLEKRITTEVCVHHLYFSADDYLVSGNLIKCNPAIKSQEHKNALFPALLDNHFDIIATDHAPHTWDEKQQGYIQAPSGLPLVQHSLNIMLEFCQNGKISKERIIEKMCHAPADCFRISERGYIDEGYKADLVLVDPNKIWTVNKSNIQYKCGWSPLEGKTFTGKVVRTIINGEGVFDGNEHYLQGKGQRLLFDCE